MSADDFDTIASMSQNQLFELMTQMKPLFEDNRKQSKQILVDNPALAQSLIQAQIMLGMTQAKAADIQKLLSQSKSAQVKQQLNVRSTQPSPIHSGIEALTNISQLSMSASTPLNPSQPSISFPSASIPSSNFSSQTAQSLPQYSAQISSIATPHSSQIHNFPPLPQPPAPPHFSTPQGQLSGQMSGVFNQPFQPPLPQQPRPQSMQPFSHQLHSHMPHGVGFQPTGLPHHLLSQPMFHSGNNHASSFPQQQPPLPSQPPPHHLYQGGGSHVGPDYNNQTGTLMQAERRAQWMPRFSERSNGGPHLSGPPPMFPGQTALGPSGGQPRPPPLTPDMEKALLQQVMSLTPEQINMLPPEQRQQVIQLQEMLR